MRLKEICTANLATLSPESTLVEAAKKMLDNDIGALPVIDHDELAGIVTDRDIAVRAVARNLDPKKTQVKEIMSEDVLSCSPDDDVAEALKMMEDKQVRRLVISDQDNHPLGIVSLGDLALRVREDRSGKTLKGVSEPH